MANRRRRRSVGLLGLLVLTAGLAAPAHGLIPENPELWAARYNGPANGGDNAHSLGVSPDGSTVFVTGESVGSGSSYDYATVAYSVKRGAQLWVARYNGPANSDDQAYSLGVSPDGSTVFVTGNSVGSSSSADYATVAYSVTSGAQLWVARYNGPGNSIDAARSLGVSPDGSTVFVTGASAVIPYDYDYATVAYSAASGAQLWATRYNVPGNINNRAYSLGVSSDGSKVFVTGSSVGSGSSYDYATVAYSAASGAQLWATRYNGPGNSDDSASSLGVSPDGSTVFVTGFSYGLGISYDYATVAYRMT